jgi:hypothetical protein
MPRHRMVVNIKVTLGLKELNVINETTPVAIRYEARVCGWDRGFESR